MCPTWRRSKQPLASVTLSPASRHSATCGFNWSRLRIFVRDNSLCVLCEFRLHYGSKLSTAECAEKSHRDRRERRFQCDLVCGGAVCIASSSSCCVNVAVPRFITTIPP